MRPATATGLGRAPPPHTHTWQWQWQLERPCAHLQALEGVAHSQHPEQHLREGAAGGYNNGCREGMHERQREGLPRCACGCVGE